jgi:Mycothiol maleylpyruvate isomerase N-terminal domain
MARPQEDHLWALTHAERAALAEDLAGLGAEQWRHDTPCGEWDVERVVAHLTAAASLNQWQWLRSMLGARFRPDVHNQRRLAEHYGPLVTGSTLALVMSMAGRVSYLAELDGPGVPALRSRLQATAA